MAELSNPIIYSQSNPPPPQDNLPSNPQYQQGNYPQGGYPPGGGYSPQGGYPPGGMYGGGPPPGPPPNNHMGQAVLAVFCCWPFAIPAIINSSQVQSRWAMGDQAGARAAAAEAKKWANIGIWLGVAWIVLVVLCYVIAFMFALSLPNWIPAPRR